MSQFDKFVDTYLCKALRKLRWGCWSFLLVAVVVHNTIDEHPEDFAFGTFLFGMSVSMFLFLYCFKKLMPKSFRPGVYVVGKVDEDTVKISRSKLVTKIIKVGEDRFFDILNTKFYKR